MAKAAKKASPVVETPVNNVTPIFRSTAPTHKLFQTFSEEGKSFKKVGAGWVNKDGSINITLDRAIGQYDDGGRVRLQLRVNTFHEEDTAKQRAKFDADNGEGEAPF